MSKIKRFALFTGAQYECSLGFSGYDTSFDTLPEMKDFILEIMLKNDPYIYCLEEWEVDDIREGKVLYESSPIWDIEDEDFILFMGKRRVEKLVA